MRISAAITGDLPGIMKSELKLVGDVVAVAVKESTEGMKDELRNDVRRAGLGNRLANSWRSNIYPNNAPVETAGLVFSKAPKIIAAHEGVTIKSKDGFFIAIPTESAPKKGVGGKRINPSNWPSLRYGPLRFVYRQGKPSLLVADSLRQSAGKRGGFRKASASAQKTGRGLTSVVMFILVPQVKLKKKFDINATQDKWSKRFFERLAARLSE